MYLACSGLLWKLHGCPEDLRERPVSIFIACSRLTLSNMINYTGMDIQKMADRIFEYTSGYPYLVSAVCKTIDEKLTGSDEFPDKSPHGLPMVSTRPRRELKKRIICFISL